MNKYTGKISKNQTKTADETPVANGSVFMSLLNQRRITVDGIEMIVIGQSVEC